MDHRILRTVLLLLSAAEDALVFLLCLCFFAGGGYGVYDSWLVYRQANDDSILMYRPGYEGDAVPEKEIQGRMVGWLTLEGTGIDYPVMQGESNFEYLNKNPYGEYSLSGSIFLDTRNSSDFSDAYSLLYGHHMELGYMFGDLDRYREEEFFREHREGTLIIDGKENRISIFAVLEISATDELIFSPEGRTREEILEKVSESALFSRTAQGNRIIAFSTCRYPDTAERTVVFGTME